MKKIILASLVAAICGISLNAAVYATVNGQNVTDQDIKALLGPTRGAVYEQLPPATQKKVVEQAIERKLLAANAIKSGIENDASFKKALKKIKSNLALEMWMKKVFSKVNVTEDDIKAFYKKNTAKFIKPSRAKARHILVKTQKEAQAIIDELKNLKGNALSKKFIELAKAKSTGPSGKNGGELGWFNKRQMVKPFSDAAFGLKKGNITLKPVKTQFGYHIIYLQDKEIGKKATFAEVKSRIENALKMDKFRKKVAAQAKELRKGAKVTIK